MQQNHRLSRSKSLPSSLNTRNLVDMDSNRYWNTLRDTSSLDNLSEFMKKMKISRKIRRTRAKLTMAERLEKAAPYNIFFNCLEEVPETYAQPDAIEFRDLICPSLGKLKCSLHICFVVAVRWLLSNYKIRGLSDKPLTIIHSTIVPRNVSSVYPNVTCKFIEIKDPMGCHDTKMGIYVYEDESVRVSVGSPNPYSDDWKFVNQGIWVSPLCPKLDDSRHDVQGESPTGFKKSLLEYLRYYNEDCLRPYIDYVRRANFSEIKVFFIYSVPGTYTARRSGCHMHQVGNVLSRFCRIPDVDPSTWNVVAQTSVIGFLGQKPRDNISYYGLLARTLSKHIDIDTEGSAGHRAKMNIIYPSAKNVIACYFMRGSTVGYDPNIYEGQKSLDKFLLQWKLDPYNRSKVIPHIRSYFRISPCSKKLAYFLLTSANLTRSGWGVPNYNRGFSPDGIFMRSYEAGVLFIPKFFGQEYFSIHASEETRNKFPFLFNLPLVPYETDDVPWTNIVVNKEDDNSRVEDENSGENSNNS